MAGKVSDGDPEKTLSLLKNSRTGKKGSITKRIQSIEKYLTERASRRLIERLLSGLRKVFTELEQVCKDISDISVIDQNNCIENYRADIEM